MKATKSLCTLPWLLLFPLIAHAGDVPGTYAKYQWGPSVTPLTSIDFDINVQADPGYRANVLWSTRFVLSDTGDIGRAGMEDNANIGPNFVFTVQGATQYKTGAAGSYCVVHSGDNPRVTCRLPYNWIETENYQFHVAYEGGQWLGVTVTDLYHPTVTFKLGSVLTNATSISPLGMVGRTTYLEASSPNSNCYNQPYSDAILGPPSGNGGQYTASVSSAGADTACVNSSSVLNNEHFNGGGNLLRGLYTGDDGLCVDAGNGAINIAATTQTCDKTKESQAFVLGSDGTMRLQSNLCLDVANAASPAGSGVIVDQCTGSASQQWWVGGSRNLLYSSLAGSEYCLTEGAAGTQLTIQECTGQVGQNWSMPTLPVLP
jgi:hypothetical protein